MKEKYEGIDGLKAYAIIGIVLIFEMREQVAEMAGKNYGNLKAHRK